MGENTYRDSRLPTIASLDLEPGQRVLLRLDVNVPLARGKVADDFRLRQALPAIEMLLKRKAAVVILSHLGRPDGKRNPAESLKPIAAWFSRKLGRDVKLYDPFAKKRDFDTIQAMHPRSVAMLENLRFYPGEEANDVNFASALACLGDAYINDAFSVSHRANASVDKLAKMLPAAAGPLLHAEIAALEKVTVNPVRPLVAVVGGAKLGTKLPLLKQLLAHCDRVLVGGAMANSLLAAMGHAVGASPIEKSLLPQLAKLVANHKLLLPLDVVSYCRDRSCRIVRVGHTGKRDINNDVGPMTAQLFGERIAWAKTLVWNGPMGLFEQPQFSGGTHRVARAIAANRKAFTVVGGGETVQAVQQISLAKKFSFVSTGGGAMLAVLAGDKLPGLKALGYYGKIRK